MDLKRRAEIFINVHKGLRRGLWVLALQIGELDWNDAAEVESLGKEIENLLRFLREHAAIEDEIQFPFLEEREPGATQQAREEHREIDYRLDLMEKHWYRLLREQERELAGYQFYLEYNRFLARYLDHMDREERDLTEAFYRHCTDPEIEDEFKKILSRTSPRDMGMMLTYMIRAMNPSERAGFMARTKAAAAPDVFAKVRGLARMVLEPKSWKKLSGRLN
jgi:hemerythrin-like domain-containing protein